MMQRDPIEVACEAFVSARSGRACSLRDAMSVAIAVYRAAGGWAQPTSEQALVDRTREIQAAARRKWEGRNGR